MTIQRDPALFSSNFERKENDAYYTEPWVTKSLVPFLPDYLKDKHSRILEPAAGRGDMSNVFEEAGFQVDSFDLTPMPGVLEKDFFTWTADEAIENNYMALITNPPFGDLAEKFLRHAFDLGIPYVAMLLRSEFNSGKGRMDLFRSHEKKFAHEIVLTTRPRWDWWFRDKPIASPRHNYSWFVWDDNAKQQTQHWVSKDEAISAYNTYTWRSAAQ